MKHSTAIKYRQHLNSLIAPLNDEDALEMTELFPMWSLKAYSIGDRVQYDEKLYKCVQAHTAQSDWAPDITPNLWTRVSVDEYPEWIQPTGAQDAYMMGDKVTHNGLRWISDLDYNVYEPVAGGFWHNIE